MTLHAALVTKLCRMAGMRLGVACEHRIFLKLAFCTLVHPSMLNAHVKQQQILQFLGGLVQACVNLQRPAERLS